MVVRPSMDQPLPYDPRRDLAPVSLLARSRNLLVVAPSLPVTDLASLIALARLRPGQLSYAHSGIGFSTHLGLEMLKQQAGGLDITGVPYNNQVQILPDMLQGRISMTIRSGPLVIESALSGELRAIAVTSTERMPQLPSVPTIAEQGFPGFEANAWFGLIAPARTPAEILDSIYREVAAVLAEPAMQQRVDLMGLVAVGNSPAEFAELVPREIARMAEVLRPLGLLRGG